MSKRLIFLNLVLLGLCTYIGRSVYSDFLLFQTTHDAHGAMTPTEKEDTPGAPALKASTPEQISSAVDGNAFLHVSQKNLFLESRSLTQETAATVEVVPQLNPKPILIGVIKVGNESKAMLLNPATGPGQKGSSTVRLGDIVQGYKVSEITTEVVQLTYTSPSGTVTSQSLDLKDLKGRPQRTLNKTPIVDNQVVNVAPRPVPPAGVTPAAVPQAPLRANEYIDGQGRRVARTPFGDKILSSPIGEALGGPPSASPMGTPAFRQNPATAGRPYP